MPDMSLAQWCANIAWAVTTEAECYSWRCGSPERFALYDGNEGGPPIAVFEHRETAERVADALIRVGRTAPACSCPSWTSFGVFRHNPGCPLGTINNR